MRGMPAADSPAAPGESVPDLAPAPPAPGGLQLPGAQQPFGLALAAHRAGRLTEAARLYRRVLADDPRHFDSLHLLGLCATQSGQPALGVHCIERALAVHDGFAAAHNHLGNALRALGRHDDAMRSFERALSIDPDCVDALHNRGSEWLERADPGRALADYERAALLRPADATGPYHCAQALKALGRWDDALASLEQAVGLDPGHAPALHNRGNLLRLLGRPQEALASLDRALASAPRLVAAQVSRGVVLLDLGDADAALRVAEHVLQGRRAEPGAAALRGHALAALHRSREALQAYERALALDPARAEVWVGRGHVLHELGFVRHAAGSFERALAIEPARIDARVALGTALQALGRLPEALQCFEQAMAHDPGFADLPGLLLRAKAALCDWEAWDGLLSRCAEGIRAGQRVAKPFIVLGLFDDPDLQRQSAETDARARLRPAQPLRAITAPVGRRDAGARWRIGFFSADFREHATMHLAAAVFEQLDHGRFEWHGFSFGPQVDDAMRCRAVAAFDAFHDVSALSDAAVVQRARDIGLNLAVDLKGYTEHARPGLFTRGCAPVQVSFLGHLGTLGTDAIDYVITDRVAVPPSSESDFVERIVQLPHCMLPGDPGRPVASTRPTRPEAGLPERRAVFCCFNSSHKIQPAVFDAWMRILRSVDGSVLWLLQAHDETARHLRREADARGVDGTRLVFAPRLPNPEHLARLQLADLFLDTWPYNAHTTASDAMWAGLPVLTLPGRTLASRVAASLLHTAGLDDMIAGTADDYVRIAVKSALEPQRIDELKARVAAARRDSVLFDAAGYARSLQRGFELMLERHAAGLSPERILLEEEGAGWTGRQPTTAGSPPAG